MKTPPLIKRKKQKKKKLIYAQKKVDKLKYIVDKFALIS